MAARVRISFGFCVVVTALGLGAIGCDAGGLLVVETKGNPEAKFGPASNELVSGGTVAKNGKYTLVYTMGQPTPQSRVTGPNQTLNGGVVGATQP